MLAIPKVFYSKATKKRKCCFFSISVFLERVMGIEPTYLAWKASVLPLNYTRIYDCVKVDSLYGTSYILQLDYMFVKKILSCKTILFFKKLSVRLFRNRIEGSGGCRLLQSSQRIIQFHSLSRQHLEVQESKGCNQYLCKWQVR